MQRSSVLDALCIECGGRERCKTTCRRAEGRSSSRLADRLTSNELEILRSLANGIGEKGAAASLRVPSWSVHKSVNEIRVKLGARSTTHAVAMLVRAGRL